jgi:hypothetical protein
MLRGRKHLVETGGVMEQHHGKRADAAQGIKLPQAPASAFLPDCFHLLRYAPESLTKS